jgi:hypothetical protein
MKAICSELFAFSHEESSFANKLATFLNRKATGEEEEATHTFCNDVSSPAITKFGDTAHITIIFIMQRRRRVAVL